VIFWLDAQLPPQLAPWIVERFGVEASALRDIELLREGRPVVEIGDA
jgi:predicted nuclease of predicted toxin-antitoxin system